jgi:hypothetical protein
VGFMTTLSPRGSILAIFPPFSDLFSTLALRLPTFDYSTNNQKSKEFLPKFGRFFLICYTKPCRICN